LAVTRQRNFMPKDGVYIDQRVKMNDRYKICLKLIYNILTGIMSCPALGLLVTSKICSQTAGNIKVSGSTLDY
jgi:hypothetical protein